jgi:hypothetical protein
VSRFLEVLTDGPSPASCPAASLVDDFDDGGELGRAWQRRAGGAGASGAWNDGTFLLAVQTVGETYRLGTSAAYDLGGSAVAVRLSEVFPGTLATLALEDGGRRILFRCDGLNLWALVEDGDTITAQAVPYRWIERLAWRIAEEGGRVSFQTWDGATWTTIHETARPFDVGALDVSISAQAITEPAALYVDDYNLVPP